MTEEFKPISTQEELDALIRDRLKRDRAKTAEKYADYEDLKAKAAKLDELEEAQKGELERANEKIAKLEKDAADRAAAEKAREIKERVAKETGVPVELVQGADEESMRAFAESVAAYAKKPSAARVDGAGEFADTRKAAKSDMAGFVSQLFGE